MTMSSGRLFRSVAVQQDSRTPLGITRSGRPVWPIFGAEPEDDDDDDDDGDADDDDDDEDDKSKAKPKDKGEDKKDDDDDLSAAEARAERYRKRMKAADRRAAEAERKLAEAEKGDGEDGSAAVVAEKDKQIQSLSEANRVLRAERAFLLSNKFQWHDPEDVMEMALKDEDLEIEDDGTVNGMEDVLKRIAKKKPWLVKPAAQADSDKDDDDDDDDDDEDEKPRSGQGVGTRKKTKQVDREKIVATYPALHRR